MRVANKVSKLMARSCSSNDLRMRIQTLKIAFQPYLKDKY
jgi:hypothetical protein